MVTKPDIIINKSAKFTQNVLIGIAVFSGFLTVGALGNGNAGGALLFGVIAVGLGIMASKIKTTYRRVGGVDVYE